MGKLKFDIHDARKLIDGPAIDGVAVTLAMIGALDRIAELEDALCEAEARSLLNFQRYEAATRTAAPMRSWDDLTNDEKECRMDMARKMLRCGGKL